MTTRRLSAFIDALAAGRRPRPFHADPEDVDMLRVAIALRAARPGDSVPDENFVAELHEQLADNLSPAPQTNIHPLRTHRARAALVAVECAEGLVPFRAAQDAIAERLQLGNFFRQMTAPTASRKTHQTGVEAADRQNRRQAVANRGVGECGQKIR